MSVLNFLHFFYPNPMNRFEISETDICYKSPDGSLLQLNHAGNPIKGPGKTTRENAEVYLREVIEKFNGGKVKSIINDQTRSGLLLNDTRTVNNITTVGFFQQAWGIPLISRGASVNFYNNNDPVIFASGLNLETEISIPRPDDALIKRAEKVNYAEWLKKVISENVESFEYKKGKLWFADIHPPVSSEKNEEIKEEIELKKYSLLGQNQEKIWYPAPSEKIYILAQELLVLPVFKENGRSVTWKLYIEPASQLIISAFPLSSDLTTVTSRVFKNDIDSAGKSVPPYNLTYFSPDHVLNTEMCKDAQLEINDPVNGAWKLEGKYVNMRNFDFPYVSPPIFHNAAEFYNTAVSSDEFSAIACYYQVNRAFNLLESYGFDVKAYFKNTSFPVKVDHRGSPDEYGKISVNATCFVNTLTSTGFTGFSFGLAAYGSTVSIGNIWRVMLHEFSHAVLSDYLPESHYHGTLGFAHSFGDGLAAVLCDPESQAKDRGKTLPGVVDYRRHDRTATEKYTFHNHIMTWSNDHYGPPKFTEAYETEQVMSSAIFRLYRSAGGDHSSVEEKKYTADFVAYLLFRTISLINHPMVVQNYRGGEIFCEDIQKADFVEWDKHRYPGAIYHKVIRWAFQKQGAYYGGNDEFGPSVPPTSEGLPPETDIYIDSIRNGDYQYADPFTETKGIWFSMTDYTDSVTEVDKDFASDLKCFVRVKNKGSKFTQNIRVRIFHFTVSGPPAGSEFPGNGVWKEIGSSSTVANVDKDGIVIGPIKLKDLGIGENHMIAAADCLGDLSNITRLISGIGLGDKYKSYRTDKILLCDNNAGYKKIDVTYKSSHGGGFEIKPRLFPSDGPLRESLWRKILNILTQILNKIFKVYIKIGKRGGKPGSGSGGGPK
jgi:zinc metalloprotease ZmpB